MEVKYTAFKNRILEGNFSQIYLLEGEDGFFLNNGASLLKKTLVVEPNFNYAEFHGETLTSEELMASLESYPFLADHRVTLVKEFYPDKKFIAKGLKNFLQEPFSQSVLIIINSQKKCEDLKKYQSVLTVDCNKANELDCIKYVKATCENNGVSIDMECAKLVVEYCLRDMGKISNETQKLLAYASKGETISKGVIDDLVFRDIEYKIYELADNVARKKINNAVEIINDMVKKGEAPQRIIINLYYHFRRLLHVAISKKTTGELASAFRVEEFIIRKSQEQAKRFGAKALKKAVDLLADLDYKSKSSLIDVNEGMWLALFNIMAER